MTGETPRIRQMFEKTEAVCFGRLVVNVPQGAKVSWGEMLVPWEVEISHGTGSNYSNLAKQRADQLKGQKVMMRDELAFQSIEDIAEPPGKIVVGVRDIGAPGIFSVDGFFDVNGLGVHIRAQDFEHDEPDGKRELLRIATRLRPRKDGEVPTEPGACLDNAFLPDNGPAPTIPVEMEHISIGFRLAEFPDTSLSIQISPANDHTNNSLDWRIARGEEDAAKAGKSNPFNLLTTYRRGKRSIGAFDGFELLTRTPDEQNSHAYADFWMIVPGVEGDPYKPLMDIQLQTGVVDNIAGKGVPVLTDAEALVVWQKITSTIRVRPVSSAAAKVGMARPSAPLGELAATGRACPQTGWWRCAEVNLPVQGGRRQFFKAGDAMPDIALVGDRSLWQRLHGEQPMHRSNTVWELVAYEGVADEAGGLGEAPADLSGRPDEQGPRDA